MLLNSLLSIVEPRVARLCFRSAGTPDSMLLVEFVSYLPTLGESKRLMASITTIVTTKTVRIMATLNLVLIHDLPVLLVELQ
jgi:hypothetical protein